MLTHIIVVHVNDEIPLSNVLPLCLELSHFLCCKFMISVYISFQPSQLPGGHC